ncbi:MAG: Ig domain-containing protein, partial [Gemmatimonadota bacterium]
RRGRGGSSSACWWPTTSPCGCWAASYAGRLWVVGGFRAEPRWNNFDDVWYSADGAQWHRLDTAHVWSPRHELSVYVHAGRLWVAGGNAWPLQNDVWSLRIAGLTFLTQPVVEEFATARYAYRARADFNASGAPVRYRLAEGPPWLSVNGESGLVTGTAPLEPEVSAVVLEAYDAAGEAARQSYELHVIPAG